MSLFYIGVKIGPVHVSDEALTLGAATGAFIVVDLPEYVIELFECLVAFHLLFEVWGIVEILALGTASWLLEHFALFFADHFA